MLFFILAFDSCQIKFLFSSIHVSNNRLNRSLSCRPGNRRDFKPFRLTTGLILNCVCHHDDNIPRTPSVLDSSFVDLSSSARTEHPRSRIVIKGKQYSVATLVIKSKIILSHSAELPLSVVTVTPSLKLANGRCNRHQQSWKNRKRCLPNQSFLGSGLSRRPVPLPR